MSELDQEKLFYERFACLHNDPQLMQVLERYGIAAFRRSSVLESFDAFIKAQNFSGKCCLEIGTLNGLTAIILARYFDRVVTVDIVDAPLKYEIADMLGVRNIEFVNVKDNAEKAEFIRSVQFDAAFVDGDHARDTETDFALVGRCGRVLFHEYWESQPLVMQQVRKLGDVDGVVTHGKFALWTAA